jgi:hypothetical protein
MYLIDLIYTIFLKDLSGLVTHTYNPSTWKAEAAWTTL